MRLWIGTSTFKQFSQQKLTYFDISSTSSQTSLQLCFRISHFFITLPPNPPKQYKITKSKIFGRPFMYILKSVHYSKKMWLKLGFKKKCYSAIRKTFGAMSPKSINQSISPICWNYQSSRRMSTRYQARDKTNPETWANNGLKHDGIIVWLL